MTIIRNCTMLDTVIVGSGLAITHGLAACGAAFSLFEARTRLGGRILKKLAFDRAIMS